jgi:hypothetical protein
LWILSCSPDEQQDRADRALVAAYERGGGTSSSPLFEGIDGGPFLREYRNAVTRQSWGGAYYFRTYDTHSEAVAAKRDAARRVEAADRAEAAQQAAAAAAPAPPPRAAAAAPPPTAPPTPAPPPPAPPPAAAAAALPSAAPSAVALGKRRMTVDVAGVPPPPVRPQPAPDGDEQLAHALQAEEAEHEPHNDCFDGDEGVEGVVAVGGVDGVAGVDLVAGVACVEGVEGGGGSGDGLSNDDDDSSPPAPPGSSPAVPPGLAPLAPAPEEAEAEPGFHSRLRRRPRCVSYAESPQREWQATSFAGPWRTAQRISARVKKQLECAEAGIRVPTLGLCRLDFEDRSASLSQDAILPLLRRCQMDASDTITLRLSPAGISKSAGLLVQAFDQEDSIVERFEDIRQTAVLANLECRDEAIASAAVRTIQNDSSGHYLLSVLAVGVAEAWQNCGVGKLLIREVHKIIVSEAAVPVDIVVLATERSWPMWSSLGATVCEEAVLIHRAWKARSNTFLSFHADCNGEGVVDALIPSDALILSGSGTGGGAGGSGGGGSGAAPCAASVHTSQLEPEPEPAVLNPPSSANAPVPLVHLPDGTSVPAMVCNVNCIEETFELVWSQHGADQQMKVSLTDIPSLGIALQSVWREAAENGTKPGGAEYRNHRWEDRQKNKGRPVDTNDASRMALVYIVESRDVSPGDYKKQVLAPLQGMVKDPALKGAVEPVLEWAEHRVATCDVADHPKRRFIPANKVASIYVVGASRALVAGSPFFNVSNFEYAWPLRVTIPLGYGIDLIEDVGFASHLQGCPVAPFCAGDTAVAIRSKVLEQLLELQSKAELFGVANDTAAPSPTSAAPSAAPPAAAPSAAAPFAATSAAACSTAPKGGILLPFRLPKAPRAETGAPRTRKVTVVSPPSAESKHFSKFAKLPQNAPPFAWRDARRTAETPANRYPESGQAQRKRTSVEVERALAAAMAASLEEGRGRKTQSGQKCTTSRMDFTVDEPNDVGGVGEVERSLKRTCGERAHTAAMAASLEEGRGRKTRPGQKCIVDFTVDEPDDVGGVEEVKRSLKRTHRQTEPADCPGPILLYPCLDTYKVRLWPNHVARFQGGMLEDSGMHLMLVDLVASFGDRSAEQRSLIEQSLLVTDTEHTTKLFEHFERMLDPATRRHTPVTRKVACQLVFSRGKGFGKYTIHDKRFVLVPYHNAGLKHFSLFIICMPIDALAVASYSPNGTVLYLDSHQCDRVPVAKARALMAWAQACRDRHSLSAGTPATAQR